MNWQLVDAGATLRHQVDVRWPKRDRASDGTVGDQRHQEEAWSDHNPDAKGWVHALDIDGDLEPGTASARILADQLISLARYRGDRGRLKYVVYRDQIASATSLGWHWRGSGYGHFDHIHVSFTDAAEQDATPFPLAVFHLAWDGIIPAIAGIYAAEADPKTRNPAAWRLACRLADLGAYDGTPVKGSQGYPRFAMAAWQEGHGYNVQPPGKYGPVAHQLLFPTP